MWRSRPKAHQQKACSIQSHWTLSLYRLYNYTHIVRTQMYCTFETKYKMKTPNGYFEWYHNDISMGKRTGIGTQNVLHVKRIHTTSNWRKHNNHAIKPGRELACATIVNEGNALFFSCTFGFSSVALNMKYLRLPSMEWRKEQLYSNSTVKYVYSYQKNLSISFPLPFFCPFSSTFLFLTHNIRMGNMLIFLWNDFHKSRNFHNVINDLFGFKSLI